MAKRCMLGIDVGTGTVKVFSGMLEQDTGMTIIGNGIVPTNGFSKGVITDMDALAQSVRQAVECALLDTSVSDYEIFLGIGGCSLKGVSRIGSVAPASKNSITQEDVDRACNAAVITAVPEEYMVLHVLPACYWVDKIVADNPLHCAGSQLEVATHIVMMPKKIVTELTNALAKVGLTLTAIVSNAVVGAQVLTPMMHESGSLVIDMGAGITDIAVYRQGMLSLSAFLPLGGEYITTDIMQGLGVSQKHAEEVKRYYSKLAKSLYKQNVVLDCNNYGTSDKHIPYDFLYNIVETRIEEIVQLIYDYLRPLLSEAQIEKIYLTGGCALLPSMSAQMGTIFNIPVQVVHPHFSQEEYANPVNTAGFGILRYGTPICRTTDEPSGEDLLTFFMGRIKKIFTKEKNVG